MIGVAIAIVAVIVLVIVLAHRGGSSDDPMDGVYQEYTKNKNSELDTLINSYYTAYAAGDTDTLQELATPISDEEISYIQCYSQYIDSIDNIQVFTKKGLTEDSYIVSTVIDFKFKDIDTPAPGFDFFYVEKNDDGSLYINNLYGSFNQTNSIYSMDPDVTTLIAAFIQQPDVVEKQSEVQAAYDEAIDSDENLKTFVDSTLQDALVQWNIEYQEQAAQTAAEEEAAAQAALEEEENANAYMGTITSEVNVREKADKESNKVGSLAEGSVVKVYGEEGDFYKVDYDGQKAYVSKDFIKTADELAAEEAEAAETEEETDDTDDNTATTTVAGISSGDEITLTQTINIRSRMDSSSSKIAVVYAGEKVKVIMSYAEGWTKVSYGEKEGYIRTDLITE